METLKKQVSLDSKCSTRKFYGYRKSSSHVEVFDVDLDWLDKNDYVLMDLTQTSYVTTESTEGKMCSTVFDPSQICFDRLDWRKNVFDCFRPKWAIFRPTRPKPTRSKKSFLRLCLTQAWYVSTDPVRLKRCSTMFDPSVQRFVWPHLYNVCNSKSDQFWFFFSTNIYN